MKYCFYMLLVPLLVFPGLSDRTETGEIAPKFLDAVPTVKPLPEPRFWRIRPEHDEHVPCLFTGRERTADPFGRARGGSREYRTRAPKKKAIPHPWINLSEYPEITDRNACREPAQAKVRSRSPP